MKKIFGGEVNSCPRCGGEIVSDALFCGKCGAKIENYQGKLVNKRRKIFMSTFLGVVLLSAIVVGVLHSIVPKVTQEGTSSSSPQIILQDINSINGCPEFFGLEFGMNATQASALIHIKNTPVEGFYSEYGSIESSILFDDDAAFDLYGIPTKKISVCFEKLKMNGVILYFSKDDIKYEEIFDLYNKIYGEPTESLNYWTSWIGSITRVDIFDSAIMKSDKENAYIVRYMMTSDS